MPDLKFRDRKFFFSILNDSGGESPLLLPVINNPNFIDVSSGKQNGLPGIIQLIKGELGITERIMLPILDPVLSILDTSPEFATSIAGFNSTTPIEDAKSMMIKNLIPDDKGIKPMEKSIIQSMMDSHKPLMDFLKIFLEMLSVSEDIVARNLGTSIKVLGKEIGFPSRNPEYWDESLNYAQTITYALKEFTEGADIGVRTMEESMPEGHPIKDNVPNADQPSSNTSGTDDRDSLYIGYFDEDGNKIDPPEWVKNSNKWLDFDAKNESGADIKVSAPFPQLSKDFDEGIEELLSEYNKSITRLNRDKDSMVDEINKRANEINKMDLSPSLRKREIESLNSERTMAVEEFDSIIRSMNDIIFGTNVEGNNYKDENDKQQGNNDPAIVGEWVAKTRSAQLRQKYFPEQKSTVQPLVDQNGKAKEPYVFIPKFKVGFRGRNVNVDVPMAYANQIEQNRTGVTRIEGNKVFFENVLRNKKGRRYSFRNDIKNIDILHNTDIDEPYNEDPSTYFNNNSEMEYIADNVKDYYNPIEWDEILEYEVRSKKTGDVLRTEREIIQNKINVEKDYELRVIKVMNIPLVPPPSENSLLDIMPNGKRIAVLRENSIHLMEYNKDPILHNIELLDPQISPEEFDKELEISKQEEERLSLINNPLQRSQERQRILEILKEESIVNISILSSNRFKIPIRYVQDETLKRGMFIHMRKKDIVWGKESDAAIADIDNILLFKISDIEEQWLSINFVLDVIEDDPELEKHIHIDNRNKTINFPNFVARKIPEHIFDSPIRNFKINNGINSNKFIRLIRKNSLGSDRTIYTYEGDLNSGSYTDKISVDYLNRRNTIRLEQRFRSTDLNTKFDAFIYIMDKQSIVPEIFKNSKNQPIIIQGLDDESILSVARDNNDTKRIKINSKLFNKPDTQADNIYTVSRVENTQLENGISVDVLKLTQKIPQKFINKSYSGNPNDIFSFPIRIVTTPRNPNDGNGSPTSLVNNETGTLFTFNNNIPDKLSQEEDDVSKNGQQHSTPDINPDNDLKEGVVFHGLDPRFVDPIKYKYFWLVEAIKKDNRGIAPINKKFNPREEKQIADNSLTDNLDKGKEWYGLIDRFTAIPMVATDLIPIIIKKLIPLVVKIIQLISNPSKIKDFIIDLGLRDEALSKFPKNFTGFSDSGGLGKANEISNSGIKIPKTLDELEDSTIPESDDYYAGLQVGEENPEILSWLDGQASIEFGKGAFGKSIIDFGINIKATNNPPIEVIDSKTKQTDFNKPAPVKDQPIITMMFNFMKLPFETIFMIFKWIIDWVKKMLNPLKIPAAVSEFLSFDWLKDILGKDSIFKILGIPDPIFDPNLYDGLITSLSDASNDERLAKLKEVLAGENPNLIEVLIYNVFINGQFIRKETEERQYGLSEDISLGLDLNLNNDPSNNNIINPNDEINKFGSTGSDSDGGLNGNPLGFCGERFFDIQSLVPIPFWTDMPSFNVCELPQVALKPLETVNGLLKMIQELLNGFLSIPTSIFGLDPQISLPKFGQEIPFANIIEDIIEKLKKNILPVVL